ncbi:hypothetical protein LCGC14_0956200 [marine sediment metagenome]|uniref:HD domain-containing protein n=1 Tax=marine sediment metagenome TaxID=412755 RepID=A0A0F9NKF0_9ZZZZ
MENSEKKAPSSPSFIEVEDDILINFFCDRIEKDEIKIVNEMELFDIHDEKIEELRCKDKYKDIDKNKLAKILKDLLIEGKKGEDKAKVLKLQKLVFQRLWPHFVRNAIKLLRQKDPRDKGILKFDFGVKKLMDYFQEFSKFEELLYGIDEYYRDHSLHVFRVYFLGEYLIRESLKGYEKIKILNLPNVIGEIKPEEKESMWCIIALCHDLGYPLQKLDELNKKLVKILEYFGTSNFHPLRYSLPLEGTILDKFILNIISSRLTDDFKIHLQSKFYTKYSNAYEKLSHGIMSCILLMKNLVYFKETDYEMHFPEGFILKRESGNKEKLYKEAARQFIIRKEILRAIASHDNEDIYHVKMNNFLFLLIMCDELQEWSRPTSHRRVLYPLEDMTEVIKIAEFSKESIDIELTLSFSEDDLKEYSKKKFVKFIRLLRSAVASDSRKFNFKIVVTNRENYRCIFEYDSPKKFYDTKKDPSLSYDEPKCEKINPDDTIDQEFTLKTITDL